jgi:hypothetical protein
VGENFAGCQHRHRAIAGKCKLPGSKSARTAQAREFGNVSLIGKVASVDKVENDRPDSRSWASALSQSEFSCCSGGMLLIDVRI